MVKSKGAPQNLDTFVDVLGEDLAIEFILSFGGSSIYLAANPKSRSSVAAVVGHDRATALARRMGAGELFVPTAKRWVVERLNERGESVRGIARRLHISDRTVQSYLKTDDRQMSLF